MKVRYWLYINKHQDNEWEFWGAYETESVGEEIAQTLSETYYCKIEKVYG